MCLDLVTRYILMKRRADNLFATERRERFSLEVVQGLRVVAHQQKRDSKKSTRTASTSTR